MDSKDKRSEGELLQGQAEQELQRSERMLHKVLDLAPAYICAKNLEGRFLLVNQRLADFYGRTAKEMTNMLHAEVCEDQQELAQMLAADRDVMENGRHVHIPEETMEGPDGSMAVLETHKIPFTADGAPAVLIISADITERKRTDEALKVALLKAEKLAREADAANEAKSQFLANITHELRTPLNGVLGMNHLLRDTPLTEEQHEFIDMAISSAQALKQLINNVLDYAKMESQAFKLDEQPLDLRASLIECVDELQALADQKQIELLFDVSEEVPFCLMGDSKRIKAIIWHLTANAIKFTSQGSVHVKITQWKEIEDLSLLRITITDTGIGIPKDKQPFIFDQFYQGDGSSTRRHGGTGIGLTIVKQLLQRMVGEIEFSSEQGHGTEFRVSLALKKATPPPSWKPVFAPKGRPKSVADLTGSFQHINARVLVVEDNPTSMLFAVNVLQKFGIATGTARNGEEALKALEKEPFDLILMDIQMPVMDGLEATRRIRLHEQTIPIIALTAHLETADRATCLEAGMNDHLEKPINPHALANILETWLTPKRRTS